MPAPSVPTPRGLQAIYATLKQIYPDQPNPLQVTALVKYWLVYLQVNHVVTYALTTVLLVVNMLYLVRVLIRTEM